MRLFTPTQAQDRVRQEQSLNAVRSKEMNDVLSTKRVKIAETEAQWQKLMASQRARWAIEEQEHHERVGVLVKQAEEAEHRLQVALVPIAEREQQAKIEYEKAAETNKKADRRLLEAEELTEKLTERLDSLDERERAIEVEEGNQHNDRLGIEAQKKMTAEGSQQLSVEMANHYAKVSAFQAEKAEFEAKQQGFEVQMQERLKRAQEQEARNRADRAQIEDAFDALASAQKEYGKK